MTEEIHREGIKRELPCKLTNDELLDIAIKKSKLENTLEEDEEKFDDVKGEWKAKLEAHEAQIAVHRTELRTGEQKRVVECYERWKGQQLELVRTDTGEVVDTRASTLRDTQQTMPGTEDDEPVDVADAAATQRAAGVDESEDGDVIPIEKAAGDRKKKRK